MTATAFTGPHRLRSSRGFSLIELLVAVLVMGIGVLGVTALQMVSLQNNRAALVRAEAVQLAYDVMDRIRANPAGTPLGADYAIDLGDGPPNPPGGYCQASSCTEAQMVDLDLAVWKCQLGNYRGEATCQDMFDDGLLPANAAGDAQQAGIPNGDGSIVVNGDGVIQVTVQWRDMDGADQSIVIDSQG